jgi:hypothetical protein
VGVRVHRNGDVRVPKTLLHDLGMDPRTQGLGRPRVARSCMRIRGTSILATACSKSLRTRSGCHGAPSSRANT